ncbi:hypothetical protein ASG90_04420 [Nocardioides sp. Soil797]|nr:hypothetical protein ASG90_04420 [Nocardioides sp. Soil797]
MSHDRSEKLDVFFDAQTRGRAGAEDKVDCIVGHVCPVVLVHFGGLVGGKKAPEFGYVVGGVEGIGCLFISHGGDSP